MKPIRILDSSAFRLALLYMSLFGISVILLLGFIYWTTASFMERQTVETINAEIQGLAEQYTQLGLTGLIDVINQRVSRESTVGSFYLLTDDSFAPLVGNLKKWPDAGRNDESWIQFSLGNGKEQQNTILARQFFLEGKFHLLVGRDVSEKNAIQRKIIESLGWGLGMTIVLGIFGGLFMSRGLLRRIENINRTSMEIMRGDLTRRMPLKGGDDEFDQLAQNLNSMLDQIEHLMNGIKQVSDNIAHDLRTPLNRIRSRLEVSLLEKPDVDVYRKILQQTIDEADELLKTFNALLTITQAEAGSHRETLKEIDLGRLVRDVAELYEPLAEEKGLAFKTQIHKPGLKTSGNQHLLAQALANLLDNAIKYTPEGGTIELTLGKQDGELTLSVADTGPGIPRKERSKVLERFYRLESSRCTPGSGLGLSLVSAVAKLHHGRLVFADNSPGLKVTIHFKNKPTSHLAKNS
ncbi:MAG: ATP-binding protein [Desulfovibrionales bacterium]